jgi:hypothetical protein
VPTLLGFNPLVAPHKGAYSVAGYGPACSATNLSTSIVGPDGLTYPVVVPGSPGTAGESTQWLPGPQAGGANDNGRTWTTVSYSEALITPKNSNGYKLAGAVAATAGWAPIGGPSASPKELTQVLRIEPNGTPHIVSTKVTQPLQVQDGGPATTPLEGGFGAIDLAASASNGWKAASNEGTGYVQAQFQEDGKGHRRVLVRGYEVRISDGKPQVSTGYWTGTGWVAPGKPTLKQPVVMNAG